MATSIATSHKPQATMRRAGLGRGFTLAEIMIALGIMAVGMSMAAALFPAAVKENELSNKSVMGQLVASNALVVAQTALKQGAAAWTGNNVVVIADDATTANGLGNAQLQYPALVPPATVGTSYGFVLLGRKIDMGSSTASNQYQLLAVSYKKTGDLSANDKVQCVALTCPVPSDPTAVKQTMFPLGNGLSGAPGATGANLVGSPIIAPDGEYATIVGWDGANLIMDHQFVPNPVNPTMITGAAGGQAYVVVETTAANKFAPCPAMTVLETRTGLGN